MNNKKYTHLSYGERATIALLKIHHFSIRHIALLLGRSPSTISREVRRNAQPYDGTYITMYAQQHYNGRRRRARQGSQFSYSQWRIVHKYLKKKYSPEQISGILAKERILNISHETIYRHIWNDRINGGTLYKHLRQALKLRRKRHNSQDSRGRLAGKKMIDQRPAIIEKRSRLGDWEIDTVVGPTNACIITLVDRKSGYLMIGKSDSRKTQNINDRIIKLINRCSHKFKTITSDNGTEFNGYKTVEQRKKVPFFFAQPYHSWERGTNENTNGLIRQYIPKRSSMDNLSQHQCNAIADKLNNRPRKRHGFKTPKEIFNN